MNGVAAAENEPSEKQNSQAASAHAYQECHGVVRDNDKPHAPVELGRLAHIGTLVGERERGEKKRGASEPMQSREVAASATALAHEVEEHTECHPWKAITPHIMCRMMSMPAINAMEARGWGFDNKWRKRYTARWRPGCE